MITHLVTKEALEKWRQYSEQYAASMRPNRKTGQELDDYFRKTYAYQSLESERFQSVVESNIMENEFSREKLPPGTAPDIRTYTVGNVYIGIDIISGEFQVECDDTAKAVPIYDDLFVYRGLDERDLKNYVMVGQYAELTQE